MNIFAFVGRSGAGKTRLLRSLIGELKARRLSVAVIKHCPHGFALESEDKDSHLFVEAGSDTVVLLSPERRISVESYPGDKSLADVAREQSESRDIVLVEGGRREAGLAKIEVLRAGLPEKRKIPPQELIAVVADEPLKRGIPVFAPDEISRLADFLESHLQRGLP